MTEEVVEEAIKKIFSDQNCGMHNVNKSESWVRFSLRMIYAELKKVGKTRNITEIKQAIEVMSSCLITLYQNNKEVWKGAVLQDLVTVGRKDYIANTESSHIARLPLFISDSINKLEYRQFNYQRLMNCKNQLSRWIYKKLINNYA